MTTFIDYFGDLSTQAMVLRWLQSFVVLGVGIELFRSIHLIRNERVTTIVYSTAMVILVFFVAKIVAAMLDDNLRGIGLFSNVINISFWSYVYVKCYSMRKSLQSEMVGEKGRLRVSQSLDEILNEMDRKRRKLEKVI